MKLLFTVFLIVEKSHTWQLKTPLHIHVVYFPIFRYLYSDWPIFLTENTEFQGVPHEIPYKCLRIFKLHPFKCFSLKFHLFCTITSDLGQIWVNKTICLPLIIKIYRHLPLIKIFTVNYCYLPFMKKFIVNEIITG